MKAKPFCKWAGGKLKMADRILALIPDHATIYVEPFVGGGAVFFALSNTAMRKRFKRVVLNDGNESLMDTYMTVLASSESLIKELHKIGRTFVDRPFKDAYQTLRAREPAKFGSIVFRAARFIALNKTCFNGLYRVNRKGEFNVPCGKFKTMPTICAEDDLRAASRALEGVRLKHGDFSDALKDSFHRHAFVYFDPPYVPVSASADFTSYTKEGFDMADHIRLRDLALRLKKAGATVALSNADVPAVRKLYAGFQIERVEMRRNINSAAGKRGPVGELLIT